MSLNWNMSEGRNPFAPEEQSTTTSRFHYAESTATEDEALKDEVEEALEKAMAFLNANVKNESRYFLVEWDVSNSTLRLAVTDDHKQQDAADVVCCRFAALNQRLQAQGPEALALCSEKVQFWLKDYLSSCAVFMNYSLVAVFTDGTRDRVRML